MRPRRGPLPCDDDDQAPQSAKPAMLEEAEEVEGDEVSRGHALRRPATLGTTATGGSRRPSSRRGLTDLDDGDLERRGSGPSVAGHIDSLHEYARTSVSNRHLLRGSGCVQCRAPTKRSGHSTPDRMPFTGRPALERATLVEPERGGSLLAAVFPIPA